MHEGIYLFKIGVDPYSGGVFYKVLSTNLFPTNSVLSCDIPDPFARLFTAPAVQPPVVESRDGEHKDFLCVDVSVQDCEWGGADGLRVGGVEDRARRNEGSV